MDVAKTPPAALPQDFRGVYQREFDYVCRSLRRLGVQGRDLKDLSQEVFLTAFRRLGTYDRSRPIRPWLFGIAFRVVSDFKQKPQGREVWDEARWAAAAVGPGAEAELAEREARQLVLRALEELPPERRAVLVMHELDECAVPEIAQTLGLPLNTAYSRLRVGRQEFAAAIKRLFPAGVEP